MKVVFADFNDLTIDGFVKARHLGSTRIATGEQVILHDEMEDERRIAVAVVVDSVNGRASFRLLRANRVKSSKSAGLSVDKDFDLPLIHDVSTDSHALSAPSLSV